MCIKREKEADFMISSTAGYNKNTFLLELENSLKEMTDRRKSESKKEKQSSWRDLFTKEK